MVDKNLSVLIPFYNEEKTLAKTVQRIFDTDPDNRFIYIFIDDGSTDHSRELLDEVLNDKKLRAIRINLDKNLGKAFAVKSALDLVSTTHFAILDADLELDPSDLHKMWNFVENQSADAVFGFRRFLSHSSFTYRYTLGNRFISNWFGIFYNVVHTDIMCGLKIVPLNLVKKEGLRLRRFAIEIELPIVLWKNNVRVYEVEVDYSPRGWQDGKVIGFRDASYILFAIIARRLFFDRKEKIRLTATGDIKR